MDLNQYIGIPYQPRGRSLAGLDCYGLIKLVFEREHGVDLPDWNADISDLRAVVKQMQAVVGDELFQRNAVQLDEPEDWAIIIVDRVSAAHHAGICIYDGVLHALERVGVVYQPLSAFHQMNPKVRYYRWLRCSSSKIL